jgi:hypothetical protein
MYAILTFVGILPDFIRVYPNIYISKLLLYAHSYQCFLFLSLSYPKCCNLFSVT